MLSHWLAALVDRRKLWRLSSGLLLLSMLMLADGWLLVRLARRMGVYLALALEGGVAVMALLVVGGSITFQISRMRDQAEQGTLSMVAYPRMLITIVAGTLLILPGFASDVVGIVCLASPIRELLGRYMAHRNALFLRRLDESLKLTLFAGRDGLPDDAPREPAGETGEREQ